VNVKLVTQSEEGELTEVILVQEAEKDCEPTRIEIIGEEANFSVKRAHSL
jgi:hypothetical protein